MTMKTRLIGCLGLLALYAGAESLPAFTAHFGAAAQRTVSRLRSFEEVPAISTPANTRFMSEMPLLPEDTESHVMLSGLGLICTIDVRGRTSNPFTPFAGYRGLISFAIASINGGQNADTVLVAPAEPAPFPLKLYSLGTPPAPVSDVNAPTIHSSGMRLAVGNLTGDARLEAVATIGPGTFAVLEIGRDGMITHSPFGLEYTGDLFVAIGDVDGDGFAEIFAGQGLGGEVKILGMDGNHIMEIGGGRPFGHDHQGGVRVASGDVNRDGKDDITVSMNSGGTHVRIFGANPDPNGHPLTVLGNFFAAGPAAAGGVRVITAVEQGEQVLLIAQGQELRKYAFDRPGGDWRADPSLPLRPFGAGNVQMELGSFVEPFAIPGSGGFFRRP
jgi:hypothetical protein